VLQDFAVRIIIVVTLTQIVVAQDENVIRIVLPVDVDMFPYHFYRYVVPAGVCGMTFSPFPYASDVNVFQPGSMCIAGGERLVKICKLFQEDRVSIIRRPVF
jgi:hypothetical protein